jgi:pyruvate-formate lyase-activating enzyme
MVRPSVPSVVHRPLLFPRQLNIKMLDLCNATCSFCGYSKDRLAEKIRGGYKAYTLDVDALIAKLPALKRKGIGILHLTGGEPTLHPRFAECVRQAKDHGFSVRTGTNGSLLDPKRIDTLIASGIDFLWYSLDTFPFDSHLRHRGFLSRESAMRQGLRELVARGVNVFGQTVLSRVLPLAEDGLPDIEGHMRHYHEHFGLTRFVFSYPMHRPDTGDGKGHHHLATEGGDAVTYTREELLRILRKVLALKDRPGSPTAIVNPYLGLMQQIRELEGRDTHMPCMAGQDIFFLGSDEATLRPCYHHSDTVVDSIDGEALKPAPRFAGCRDCRDQCFRDPSLMFAAAHAPMTTLKQIWHDPIFAEYALRDLYDIARHRGYRRAD